MLTFDTPMAAFNNMRTYLTYNIGSLPPYLQELALSASQERSPVVGLVRTMEVMNTAFSTKVELSSREDGLNALGAVAEQVFNGGFWGKEDRSAQMQSQVKFELGELPQAAPEPGWPEVDPEYAEPTPSDEEST